MSERNKPMPDTFIENLIQLVRTGQIKTVKEKLETLSVDVVSQNINATDSRGFTLLQSVMIKLNEMVSQSNYIVADRELF